MSESTHEPCTRRGRNCTDVHARTRELTQQEMADVLGITTSGVQKIERLMFAKLKAEFAKRGIHANDADALLIALLEK